MAKKPTLATDTDTAIDQFAEHFTDAPMPAWFDAELHSAGTGGIYETATGTLLDEDGLPQSGPARAALRAKLAAELAADAPAADAAAAPAAAPADAAAAPQS